MPIRSPFPASALRPNGALMALSDTLKRGEVGASLKGQFYQYQRHGKWVTAKWPKKRGKPKSAAQSQAQKDFAAVCRAIKLTAAEIQMYARANAAGTPMLPRDAMMAALYGNGPTIRTYSGKVIKPMANKLLSSTVLDAIGWQEGDLLYRGTDTWEVLRQGDAGKVLLSNGPGAGYQWGDAGGGSGAVVFYYPSIEAHSSSAYRVKGQAFRGIDEWKIDRIYFEHGMPLGWQMGFTVAFLDASGVVTSVPMTIDVVAEGSGAVSFGALDLPFAVVVPAGQRVAMLYHLKDQPSGTALTFAYAPPYRPPFPAYPYGGYINSNVLPVAIGNSFSIDPANAYFTGARLK